MKYLRIRRSIRLAPGVKLNLNKKSASVMAGSKGAHYTVSSNGSKTGTAGIPGSGVSVVSREKARISAEDAQPPFPVMPKRTVGPTQNLNRPSDEGSVIPASHDDGHVGLDAKRVAELLGSADKLRSDTKPDVPRTVKDQDLLVRERPKAWEYRLFASELFLEVSRLEPKWREHEQRSTAKRGQSLNGSSASALLSRIARDAAASVGRLDRTGDLKLQERAFGKPGKPGNPKRIKRLARMYITPYEELLTATTTLRAQVVPRELQEPFELTAQWLGGPASQVRRFVHYLVATFDDIDAIAKRHTGGPPLKLEHTLQISLDPAIRARIDTALRNASRSNQRGRA